MNFRPTQDKILVERVETASKTASGILLPDVAQEKPTVGTVLAVGPGGRDAAGNLIPMSVAVGDTVMFTKWTGAEIEIDGRKVLVMKESEIIGLLTT